MMRPRLSPWRVAVPWTLAVVVWAIDASRSTSTSPDVPQRSTLNGVASTKVSQRRIDTVTDEEVSGIAELEQSLRIILKTPYGSVPGRPTFGNKLGPLVDAPSNELGARIAVEVPRAVRVSDPRITIDSAKPVGVDAGGNVRVRVVWHPTGASATSQTTEVP